MAKKDWTPKSKPADGSQNSKRDTSDGKFIKINEGAEKAQRPRTKTDQESGTDHTGPRDSSE